MENSDLISFNDSEFYDYLKSNNSLAALSPNGVPLLNALWSVIESQSFMKPRWKLQNVNFDTFYQQIQQNLNPEEYVSYGS